MPIQIKLALPRFVTAATTTVVGTDPETLSTRRLTANVTDDGTSAVFTISDVRGERFWWDGLIPYGPEDILLYEAALLLALPIGDQCQAYDNDLEPYFHERALRTFLIPYFANPFNYQPDSVRLWTRYFNGSGNGPFMPEVAGDESTLANSVRDNPLTVEAHVNAVDSLIDKVSRDVRNGVVAPATFSATLQDSRPIDYSGSDNQPGNLFGGTGVRFTGEGPDVTALDTRLFDGTVRFAFTYDADRRLVSVVAAEPSRPIFELKDSVDFCARGLLSSETILGVPVGTLATLILSRLEASGVAKPVPATLVTRMPTLPAKDVTAKFDRDLDGVLDRADNCPGDVNPYQWTFALSCCHVMAMVRVSMPLEFGV